MPMTCSRSIGRAQLCRMSGDATGALGWLERSFAIANDKGHADNIGIVGLAFGIALQLAGQLERGSRRSAFGCGQVTGK